MSFTAELHFDYVVQRVLCSLHLHPQQKTTYCMKIVLNTVPQLSWTKHLPTSQCFPVKR